MKRTNFLLILLLLGICFPIYQSYAQPFNYERVWSTYFGDENLTIADNALDKDGNIYFVGRVNDGSFFPATAGSHQPVYAGGTSDGFLVKMDPQGQIIWASYYGGEHSDYISGISFDENDHLYIIGRTFSTVGIATPDSYQSQIGGASDSFIAKFTTAGERVWASYYPTADGYSSSGVIRSTGETIVADGKGFIYFVNRTDKMDAATSDVFQTEIGQVSNTLVSKFSADGERLWATYYGIHNSNVYSIAHGDGGLYLGGVTNDCPPYGQYNTYFGTSGSHQSEPGNCRDVFISKFSFDGQRLWSTYYGNTYPEYMGKNAIVSLGDDLYFAGISFSSNNITTPGSYQQDAPSDDAAPYMVKFDSDGERRWGTFLGLDRDPSAIVILPYPQLAQAEGNIYMLGNTRLKENISTPDAFQEEKSGKNDVYLAIFDPDGELKYGTYYGGEGEEYGASPLVYGDVFYMFGQTGSTEGITTTGSYQEHYMQGTNPELETNIYIAKFSPEGMGIANSGAGKFTLYPNPNNGSFTIRVKQGAVSSVEIYNTLGQRMEKSWTVLNDNSVQIDGLRSGLYFVKVISGNSRIGTLKVVVK